MDDLFTQPAISTAVPGAGGAEREQEGETPGDVDPTKPVILNVRRSSPGFKGTTGETPSSRERMSSSWLCSTPGDSLRLEPGRRLDPESVLFLELLKAGGRFVPCRRAHK
jgi:hypothetical protein